MKRWKHDLRRHLSHCLEADLHAFPLSLWQVQTDTPENSREAKF